MIRFRNPGTQYATQLQVIKELYENLGEQKIKVDNVKHRFYAV